MCDDLRFMSKIEVWMKYLVLDGGVEGSISNELCSCYTITYTFQMIYDVRWDESMKYVCHHTMHLEFMKVIT